MRGRKAKINRKMTFEELMDSLEPAGELFCLRANDIPKLKKLAIRVGYCKAMVSFMGFFSVTRKFVPVTVIGFDCYADTVTGSLFSRKSGKCLSSVFLFLDLKNLEMVMKKNETKDKLL